MATVSRMTTGLGRASRLRFVALFIPVVKVIAGCGGGDGHGIRSTPDSTTTSTTPAGSTTAQTTTGGANTSAEGLPKALGSPRAVRTAVEAVLTSADPAQACGKYATERFLTEAYGGRQGCVHA